jgi:hypothetical protein
VLAAQELTLHGGCQCGAIRYLVRVEDDEAYYCHCRMCRKAFGNLFGVFFDAPRGSVRWEGGEPAYFHSSKIARRGFCRDCGTPLSFEYLGSEKIDLAVGSLDEPGRLRPVAHYGFEGCVNSFFAEDGLPRSRTEESEWLVTRWKAAYGEDSAPGQMSGSHA